MTFRVDEETTGTIDEETMVTPQFNKRGERIHWKDWFDITTKIIKKEGGGKLLEYEVHTYPSTKDIHNKKCKRDKHYVIEVKLNGEYYTSNQLLHLEETDRKPSIKKTLEALEEHISAAKIIRSEGGRDLWEIYQNQ